MTTHKKGNLYEYELARKVPSLERQVFYAMGNDTFHSKGANKTSILNLRRYAVLYCNGCLT